MVQTNLLIGTNNPGKLREYQDLLAAYPFHLCRPGDINLDLEVVENGASYLENARLKATAFSQASGLLALADDSGLEVAALGGWPGVHSVRFAGPTADDEIRRQAILRRLVGRPPAERRATFVCAIALATGRRIIAEGLGRLDGTIATSPRGSGGFGYDPIFVPEGDARSVAELSDKEKNGISHRARAIDSLRSVLEQIGAGEWYSNPLSE